MEELSYYIKKNSYTMVAVFFGNNPIKEQKNLDKSQISDGACD